MTTERIKGIKEAPLHTKGGEILWTPARTAFQLFVGIVACVCLSVVDCLAQSYPIRPIRLVVGYSPGGTLDFTARTLAQGLSKYLGQPVVVENRTGASGAIATEKVAKSLADGYTMLMMSPGETIQPFIRDKISYDVLRDLAPVSLVQNYPFLLVVHTSVPARSVKELIALAQSRPGKLNYGTSGIGGSQHLIGEYFKQMAKVNIVHVPYKGTADSCLATASGQIEMSWGALSSARPFIESGKLRPLAVTTAKRSSLMPSIPTLDESGLPGFSRPSWCGVAVPAGVPEDIITRLNEGIVKVVNNNPELTASFNMQGLEPQTSTPEEFSALLHNEVMQNIKLIKLIGLKAQ